MPTISVVGIPGTGTFAALVGSISNTNTPTGLICFSILGIFTPHVAKYYDALIAQWGTINGGTTSQKLTIINSTTVPGPNQDIQTSTIESYLSLRGLIIVISDWLIMSPQVSTTRTAAQEILNILENTYPSVAGPGYVQMSNPTTYAIFQSYLNALQSNSPALISSQNVSDLLGMTTTTIPWWAANGYSSPFNLNDLQAAGNLT